MNTVKVGELFENKSYEIIKKAIENNELGINGKYAKVYKKRAYYSNTREKNIIFDLAIEIWPERAERYTLLYLIECKSSASKKVPVDDVEEFYTKINQVAGVNAKGVMITDNSFQDGAFTFAKNRGMMLIEVNRFDEYSFVLHSINKQKNDNIDYDCDSDIDDVISRFLHKTLGLKKIEGLQTLSKEEIEIKASGILEKFNQNTESIKLKSFINFLEKEYNLSFNFKSDLQTVNGKKILGYFDSKNKQILIDRTILPSERFPFIFGHELGHFFLHSELKVNQELYNDFEDSQYDLLSDKYILKNQKNWIEWQANKFAASLFLSKQVFIPHLMGFRKSIGISRYYHIYLDRQPINQEDYYKTVEYLSEYFNVSKTAVKYRIEELNLITYAEDKDNFKSVLRESL